MATAAAVMTAHWMRDHTLLTKPRVHTHLTKETDVRFLGLPPATMDLVQKVKIQNFCL